MEAISLIIGALAAGAVPAAGQAVKDAYEGLKTLIRKRFEEKNDPRGEMVLTEYESDQETWKKPLLKILVQAEADKDEAIIEAAQRIMELIPSEEIDMNTDTEHDDTSDISLKHGKPCWYRIPLIMTSAVVFLALLLTITLRVIDRIPTVAPPIKTVPEVSKESDRKQDEQGPKDKKTKHQTLIRIPADKQVSPADRIPSKESEGRLVTAHAGGQRSEKPRHSTLQTAHAGGQRSEKLKSSGHMASYDSGGGRIQERNIQNTQPAIVPVPTAKEPNFTNSIGMKFVLIPAGTFVMGSPEDEEGRYNNETQHRVTLTKDFHMQTTEVTQGQWESVMRNNPSYFKECGDDCPVERVSWNDAQEFVGKLNLMGEGRYRLATEAEWEYAARAGSSTPFANGDMTETGCGHDPNLDTMGWYCGNSGVKYEGCYDLKRWEGTSCVGTHPVAQKQPNQWGLYDMHGNVREWCQDRYGKYPTDFVSDPTGTDTGSYRVPRGGSYLISARHCRSAKRGSISSGYRNKDLGFRVLREAP